ncbi:MAG TPA: metallophosphoesterase, partial [Planctomycetota bacterium]|nr:metallophosphoesterase [Planctomycetota bacterium]
MRILPLFLGLLLVAASVMPTPAEDSFTICVAPDTQQEVLRANDTRFVNRLQWVLSHRTALNIKVFMQVGDLCNWDTPDHIQYQRASAGLKLLDDAHLPYVLTIGNHDTAATMEGGSAAPGNVHDNQRNTTTFNSFFPVSRHQIVKGTYEPNKIDNAWHEFTAGGLNWLVIDVELWPRAGAVTWVKNILASKPNHNAIIITHSYFNGDSTVNQSNGGYGDNSPQYLWD